MASEVMGLIYGKYGGSSHVLEAGGLSYEASFMPHGGKKCSRWTRCLSNLSKQRLTKLSWMRRMQSLRP